MGLFDLFKKGSKNTTDNSKSDSILPQNFKTATIDDIREIVVEINRETSIPYLDISFSDEKAGITDSKFGGVPYIYYLDEAPKNNSDEPMRLLVQLNCADLKELECFPESGLIQIYINSNDKMYGMSDSSQTNQDNFKILYIEEIDVAVTEYESSLKLPQYGDDDLFPIKDEYKLIFTLKNESMSIYDYHYNEEFTKKYNTLFPDSTIESIYDLEQEFCDEIYSNFTHSRHKIGGYPFFYYDDVRLKYENPNAFDMLLLQIDSNREGFDEKIKWGDFGVCNFFINSRDLITQRFSNVLYNWESL